ncbi:MAG: PadR family transcriptional regulator [Spirosomataceae bacterium]
MTESKELIRGTLKTIVLKLLAENGRMYGYEITQRVKVLTEGEIKLNFGALYPILHKLEEDGLLVTETETIDGRVRKYYSLTPKGNAWADQKVKALERFMEHLQALLGPQPSLSV